MNEDQFLKVAKEVALQAGKIISKYYGDNHELTIKNKDSSDIATQTDLESEKTIVEIISKNFPEHNIISEEKVKINKDSKYTWIIDPLDGTFNFVIGLPYFAVSIGLLKEGKPFLGVVYEVVSDKLYLAKRGKGATVNGKSIKVSSRESLGNAAISLGFGHRSRRLEKLDKYVLALFDKVGYPYGLGSTAFSLSQVANGTFDGVVIDAWSWDFAAGVLIVEEAGGRVTDFEGNEPDWTKERLEIAASNGLIHNQILEVLKKT